MGWSSGDLVFEPVADILTRSGADSDLRLEICTVLIAGLQQCGWDTESESLGKYLDDWAIVRAFAANGVMPEDAGG